MVGLNFRNRDAAPGVAPPEGFQWQFLEGGWVLAPVIAHTEVAIYNDSAVLSEKEGSETGNANVVSPEVDKDSDDSVSEFERNLRELLPDLPGSRSSSATGQTQGTRKSERQKKPLLRFNEDTGCSAEPPKLTKKKGAGAEGVRGTSSKPLLISDWTTKQIASYCDACGISFTNSMHDCINHIRYMELDRSGTHLVQEESSSEDRRN